ncbi:MAG TPA: gamma-glutamyltransferase, partial [Thermoanaerobaculia bacterium]|nr:gamma-glutamyltransferase [Thermoanaerobaculia bacterium]
MNGLKVAAGLGLGLLLTAQAAMAGSVARSTHAAVVSDSPQATQAALSVLRAGGNAIDAAVTIAFVLGVVHPHSGAVGGGGFLMFYEAEKGAVWSLDFRETAPSMATTGNGPAASGGVPGTIAGLHAMHARFGSRPWRELLQPSIALARDGVRIEPPLGSALTPAVARALNVAAQGASELRQPKMALFLERLAAHGAGDFYRGRLADQFVSEVRKSGSSISHRDLRNYQAVWRAPIRIRFRGDEVYAPPPPSGSGVVMAQLLAILEGSDLSRSLESAPGLHLFAEASRRAFIDRDRFVADPSTSRIAYRELLSAERASVWRSSIRPERVTPTASLVVP